MVCKLKKMLYRLKQSPRCWNKALKEHTESIEFKQSAADPCIFIKTEETGEVTIVAVYVDDLIIVTKSDKKLEETKRS